MSSSKQYKEAVERLERKLEREKWRSDRKEREWQEKIDFERRTLKNIRAKNAWLEERWQEAQKDLQESRRKDEKRLLEESRKRCEIERKQKMNKDIGERLEMEDAVKKEYEAEKAKDLQWKFHITGATAMFKELCIRQ